MMVNIGSNPFSSLSNHDTIITTRRETISSASLGHHHHHTSSFLLLYHGGKGRRKRPDRHDVEIDDSRAISADDSQGGIHFIYSS